MNNLPFSATEGLKRRFSKYISLMKDGGCIEWVGTLHKCGYGNFKVGGKTYLTHRFSYMLFHGKIPQDKCILHRCDNRKCVNPVHLFVGTKSDNMKDMYLKCRHSRGSLQENPNAKLTISNVVEIRNKLAVGVSVKTLHVEYSVSRSMIYKIKNNNNWKDIGEFNE